MPSDACLIQDLTVHAFLVYAVFSMARLANVSAWKQSKQVCRNRRLIALVGIHTWSGLFISRWSQRKR